jgi:Protein of unknown function (DUF3558)
MARVTGAVVVGLAALALAGCSSTSDATPPPIKLDDLNLKPYVAKPCSLFDADQLADLRMSRAAQGSSQPSAAECDLAPSDPSGSGVVVRVQTDTPNPTAGSRTKIAGYPALETHGTDDCTVRVVVADRQQIVATTKGENACHSAENVATTAIATIKRASP